MQFFKQPPPRAPFNNSAQRKCLTARDHKSHAISSGGHMELLELEIHPTSAFTYTQCTQDWKTTKPAAVAFESSGNKPPRLLTMRGDNTLAFWEHSLRSGSDEGRVQAFMPYSSFMAGVKTSTTGFKNVADTEATEQKKRAARRKKDMLRESMKRMAVIHSTGHGTYKVGSPDLDGDELGLSPEMSSYGSPRSRPRTSLSMSRAREVTFGSPRLPGKSRKASFTTEAWKEGEQNTPKGAEKPKAIVQRVRPISLMSNLSLPRGATPEDRGEMTATFRDAASAHRPSTSGPINRKYAKPMRPSAPHVSTQLRSPIGARPVHGGRLKASSRAHQNMSEKDRVLGGMVNGRTFVTPLVPPTFREEDYDPPVVTSKHFRPHTLEIPPGPDEGQPHFSGNSPTYR